MQTTNHIVILAGEALSDSLAANLVNQLQQQITDLCITGMGSHAMQTAGVDLVIDSGEFNLTGLTGLIKQRLALYRAYQTIKQHILSRRPQLVILVGNPHFNLRIANIAKKAGCQVLYYISPPLGTRRYHRIKKMKRHIDHIAVLFPFEQALYQQENIPATYVGHPIVDRISDILNNKDQNKTTTKTIALLPGNQKKEIDHLLPAMIKAATLIHAQYPEIQFVLPLTTKLQPKALKIKLPIYIEVISDNRLQHIANAICAICAAGTVTLETALLGVPHVIVYKTSWLKFTLKKYFIRPTQIGLSNIVAEKKIAPELIQHEVSPQRISQAIMPLLNNKKHHQLIQAQYSALLQQFHSKSHNQSVVDIAANLLAD